MNRSRCIIVSATITTILIASAGYAQDVIKQVVRNEGTEQNLLQPDKFRPY